MEPNQCPCNMRDYLIANIRQLEKEKAEWKAEQRTKRNRQLDQDSVSRDPIFYNMNLGNVSSWDNCRGVSNEAPTKESSKGQHNRTQSAPSCGCSVNPVVEMRVNQSQQLQECCPEDQKNGNELNQQKTSFLQKVMDNARSILSMKSVQCTESALTDNRKSQESGFCCYCSMGLQNQPVKENSPCLCGNPEENLLVDYCMCEATTVMSSSSSSSKSKSALKQTNKTCNSVDVGRKDKSANVSNVGNCPASGTQTLQATKRALVDRVNQSSGDVESFQQTDVGGVTPPCRSNAAIQSSRVSFTPTTSTPKCSTSSMKSNEYTHLQNIGDGCGCGQQSNQQSEIDKLTKEIRMENHVLKSELLEMRMQLKHCLENIEAPINENLEAERMKGEKLQSELDVANQELNNLKMKLCKACANISELNQMNRRLSEEIVQLNSARKTLEDDLANQKVREAETRKILTKRHSDKEESTVCCSTLSVYQNFQVSL